MEDIQVNFTHKGKNYSGQLSPVFGAGQPVWHLYVNKYYWGRLRYHNGWVFDSNKVPELAGLLGSYVAIPG